MLVCVREGAGARVSEPFGDDLVGGPPPPSSRSRESGGGCRSKPWGHVCSMSSKAIPSDSVTRRSQRSLTAIQLRPYRHHCLSAGGFHSSGPFAPFWRFNRAETASRRGITIQPKSGKVQFYKFTLTPAFIATLALMMDESNREEVKRIA